MTFLQRIYRKWLRRADLHALSARMADVEARIDKLSADHAAASPVVIQHAEKVVIERVAYSNHFGTLDIDDLSGQLNIGVNCRSAADLPDGLVPFTKQQKAADSGAAVSSKGQPIGKGPACKIRPRTRKNGPLPNGMIRPGSGLIDD